MTESLMAVLQGWYGRDSMYTRVPTISGAMRLSGKFLLGPSAQSTGHTVTGESHFLFFVHGHRLTPGGPINCPQSGQTQQRHKAAWRKADKFGVWHPAELGWNFSPSGAPPGAKLLILSLLI